MKLFFNIIFCFIICILASTSNAFLGLHLDKLDYTKLYYVDRIGPACTSITDLDNIIAIGSQNDTIAYDKMLTTGKCIVLKYGIPVYIMEHYNNYYVKIRPQGLTETFWTSSLMIGKEDPK